MAAFKPFLADVPSAAVIQLSKACITVLHKAHAAGQQFSTPEALTARATCRAQAVSPAVSTLLFPLFQALHVDPVPVHLEVAWDDLWRQVFDVFVDENGKPTVKVAAASTDVQQPPTARDERCAHALDSLRRPSSAHTSGTPYLSGVSRPTLQAGLLSRCSRR